MDIGTTGPQSGQNARFHVISALEPKRLPRPPLPPSATPGPTASPTKAPISNYGTCACCERISFVPPSPSFLKTDAMHVIHGLVFFHTMTFLFIVRYCRSQEVLPLSPRDTSIPAQPSPFPALRPTKLPSDEPIQHPSLDPSDEPRKLPIDQPSQEPSKMPRDQPYRMPSNEPSQET